MESVQETLNGNVPALPHIGGIVVIKISQVLLGNEPVEDGTEHPLPVGHPLLGQTIAGEDLHRRFQKRQSQFLGLVILLGGDGHHQPIQPLILHRKGVVGLGKRPHRLVPLLPCHRCLLMGHKFVNGIAEHLSLELSGVLYVVVQRRGLYPQPAGQLMEGHGGLSRVFHAGHRLGHNDLSGQSLCAHTHSSKTNAVSYYETNSIRCQSKPRRYK